MSNEQADGRLKKIWEKLSEISCERNFASTARNQNKHKQGSTEGGFLPSAEAKAEGAKKLRPLAKDQSQSRRFQMIE